MARNIRWFANFKSKNGTSCTINIYDNDWPEGVTLGVTPAANPFYFEDDDDDDILNDVLRYRTGYIRFVEQSTYGSLDDIYPTDAFERYVEVLYGSTVVFNGYIQVQDFSHELVPVPRILELPVISPLGLFHQRTIPNTRFMPPSAVSLAELLDLVLYNGPYSYVYVPKNYGYPNPVSLSMKVSTLAVEPWNKDYHYSMNTAPSSKVMKGESYEYVIEAICKAFGWICHDMPDALVFTAFDHEGEYDRYEVGHIGDSDYRTDAGVSSSEVVLTDYFTPADDDANEKTLQPDTGIEISYDGDDESRTFSFDHTYVPETDPVIVMPSFVPDQDVYPAHVEIFSMCNLVPIPNVNETDITTVMSFDNNDKLEIGVGCVAWNGKEGVMVSLGSYPSGHNLFRIRFYMRKRANQRYSFSYDMLGRSDGAIGGLEHNSDIDDRYIAASISTSNDYYVQVTFQYLWVADSDIPQLPSQALIFLYNFRLEVCEDNLPYSEYRFKPSTDSDIIGPTGIDNPPVSSSITMPISMYRQNDHLLGQSVRQEKLTEYQYLFAPRKELVSRFRISSILSIPHARLFSYMSKKWRIIAQKFSPWDDEMTLTMQSSSTL